MQYCFKSFLIEKITNFCKKQKVIFVIEFLDRKICNFLCENAFSGKLANSLEFSSIHTVIQYTIVLYMMEREKERVAIGKGGEKQNYIKKS